MADKAATHRTYFDVTCVIGSVSITEDEGLPPHVAAFQLIAEHDAEGQYHFPMPDGKTCSVTVEFRDN